MPDVCSHHACLSGIRWILQGRRVARPSLPSRRSSACRHTSSQSFSTGTQSLFAPLFSFSLSLILIPVQLLCAGRCRAARDDGQEAVVPPAQGSRGRGGGEQSRHPGAELPATGALLTALCDLSLTQFPSPAQFDNVKRVFREVEDMPGHLPELIQKIFLVSPELARCASFLPCYFCDAHTHAGGTRISSSSQRTASTRHASGWRS